MYDQPACAAYDYDDDRFGPRATLDEVKRFDKDLEDARPRIAMVDAVYRTKFWEHVIGQQDEDPKAEQMGTVWRDFIEVNRIKPGLTGYLSALYPRRLQAVLSRDPLTSGDPKLAELVVNRWLTDPEQLERGLIAARQGLLFGAAGGKIGVNDDDTHVLGRVWCSVFPRWQLLLDKDATDMREQRFIGHIHYKDADEVAADFGLPEGSLKGGRRPDFIADKDRATGSDADDLGAGSPRKGENWVRVLELCNMVDTLCSDDENQRFRGRLEIWVLDCGDYSRQPLWMGPLPLSDATGRPCPHIVPLIFEHEPAYPLRPLAYADQLMPQQVELNCWRSYQSQAGRRDARMYAAWRGTLGENRDKLERGDDGSVLEFDRPTDGPQDLRNMVVPIAHGPVSAAVKDAARNAEDDLRGSLTVSPAALGQVTNATLGEIEIVEQHTESEFGRHAERRDNWLRELVALYLKAVVWALRCPPGLQYDATYDDEVVEDPESEHGGAPEFLAEGDGDDGEPVGEPVEDEDEAVLVDAVEVDGDDDDLDEDAVARVMVSHEEGTITVMDPFGREEIVTADNLDGDFVIGFSEAGRTPAGNAMMRQVIMQLQPTYQGLWEAMQKGGPMSVFAEEFMGVLADQFELPPNLHPEALRVKLEERAEEEAEAKKDAPPPPPGQPGQPANGGAGPQPLTPENVQALLSAPPDQALQLLLQQYGELPEVAGAAQQALQSGDPAFMAEAVKIIVQALSGQSAAPPPPNGGPPPGPMGVM